MLRFAVCVDTGSVCGAGGAVPLVSMHSIDTIVLWLGVACVCVALLFLVPKPVLASLWALSFMALQLLLNRDWFSFVQARWISCEVAKVASYYH
jgi:uncharacterized membrane protein YccC